MDDARRRDEFAALSSKVRELQILADEARALRDDVDIWRSRAADHERTKAELVALTQRLEDTEYGSNRIQV